LKPGHAEALALQEQAAAHVAQAQANVPAQDAAKGLRDDPTNKTVAAPKRIGEVRRAAELEPTKKPSAPVPRRFPKAAAFGLGGVAVIAVVGYLYLRPSDTTTLPVSPKVATPAATTPAATPSKGTTPSASPGTAAPPVTLAAARSSQTDAGEARKSASLKDAPRFAPEAWARGDKAERGGEDALKKERFDQAQALFV